MKKITILSFIMLTFGVLNQAQAQVQNCSCECAKECSSKKEINCFASGTTILMANRTQKNIELIKAGDQVMTYDMEAKELVSTEVTKLVMVRHINLFQLTVGSGLIVTTSDHPFWTETKGWASLTPKKSNANYNQQSPVMLLEVGDKILAPQANKYIAFRNTVNIDGDYPTYTLELKNGGNFVANGLLVKTESPK